MILSRGGIIRPFSTVLIYDASHAISSESCLHEQPYSFISSVIIDQELMFVAIMPVFGETILEGYGYLMIVTSKFVWIKTV